MTCEVKKVGLGFYLFIALGIPLGVLLLTLGFLLLNQRMVVGQAVNLVVSNNIGAWSSLLFPLIILVLVQNLIDVETKSNRLYYSKSYKRNWIDLFLLKALIAILVLCIASCFNIFFNYILVKIAPAYGMVESSPAELWNYTISFLKLIPAFIPAIFFHLMICLAFKKSGLAYLVGIFLIILGIPIANLLGFSVLPYNFGVVVMNPNGELGFITFMGILILVAAPMLSNFLIRSYR
jgi:hypothetical protein